MTERMQRRSESDRGTERQPSVALDRVVASYNGTCNTCSVRTHLLFQDFLLSCDRPQRLLCNCANQDPHTPAHLCPLQHLLPCHLHCHPLLEKPLWTMRHFFLPQFANGSEYTCMYYCLFQVLTQHDQLNQCLLQAAWNRSLLPLAVLTCRSFALTCLGRDYILSTTSCTTMITMPSLVMLPCASGTSLPISGMRCCMRRVLTQMQIPML
jgi:hypothetical protein